MSEPNVTPFPLIDVAGTARERGEQYGRKAADQIATSVEIYRKALDASDGGWPRVLRTAAAFRERLAGYDRELDAEIEAIAAGARRPVEEIITINARTELLYFQQARASELDALQDGCTAAAALPVATRDGALLHGQNWDWRVDCLHSTVVLRLRPARGPAILTLVEAGTLARCGLNSAGLAITGNFLKCDHDTGHQGVPVPLVRRQVLQSTSLHDAMAAVIRAPRSFSNNVMISDRGGFIVDMETTPLEIFCLTPGPSGVLVHANHFLSPSATARVRDLGLAVTPDTIYRQERVSARLARPSGSLTIEDFRDALDDRFGAPFGVCREPTPGPGGEQVATVATVLMDTVRGRMWVAPGPWRGMRFFEYSLDAAQQVARDATFG